MSKPYRHSGNPATTALLDQVQAATDEMLRIVATQAAATDATVNLGTLDQLGAARIVLRLAERLMRGEIRQCAHVAAGAVQPVIWFPWHPEHLSCARCALAASLAIVGTDADRLCDNCGEVVSTIYPCTIPLPALVIDRPRPVATSPVLVKFGLCGRCKTAGRAA